MDSRYLYAHPIEKLNNDKVGVLLIETTETDFSHIIDAQGRPQTNNRIKEIIARECKRLSFYIDDFELPNHNSFEFEEGALNE